MSGFLDLPSVTHASRHAAHSQAKRLDKAARRPRQWSMTISQGMTAPAVRKDDPHLTVFVRNKKGGKADRNDSRKHEENVPSRYLVEADGGC